MVWLRPGRSAALRPRRAGLRSPAGATATLILALAVGVGACRRPRVVFEEISVEGLRVSIERAPDGSLTPPHIAERLRSGMERARPGAPLPRVTLKGSRVAFTDRAVPGAPVVVRLADLDLELRPGGAPGPPASRLFLEARLEGTGLGGHLTLHATVRGGEIESPAGEITIDRMDLAELRGYLPGRLGRTDGRGVLAGRVEIVFPPDGAARARVDLHLASQELVLGAVRARAPLRLEGALRLDGTRLSAPDLRLAAAGASLGRHRTRDLRAELAFAGRVLRIESLGYRAHEGRWRHQGSVSFGRDGPPEIELQSRVEGAEIEALRAAFADGPPPDVELGSVDGEGSFETVVADQWLDALDGTGALVARGGAFPYPSVLQSVWQAFFRVLPVAEPVPLDFTRASPTRLEVLRYPFEVHGRRTHTGALEIVTDDYRLTGQGDVSLEGELDLQAQLELTSQGARKLLILAALPFPGEGLIDFPAVSVELGGDLREPVVRPDVSRIPRLPVLVLLSGIKSVANLLDQVRRTGESVLRGAAGAARDVWKALPTPGGDTSDAGSDAKDPEEGPAAGQRPDDAARPAPSTPPGRPRAAGGAAAARGPARRCC